jgi:hypothetical protein
MRGAAWAVALVAAAGAAAYLLVPREREAEPPLREAPAIPKPTEAEKVAYFHRVFAGGEVARLASPVAGTTPVEIPVWREIGEAALLSFGTPAIEYLLSPERHPAYLAAPNLLVGTLQILARAPEARNAEGLYPFLATWLDPAKCPPAVPGSDWPADLRKLVFSVFQAHPAPAAIPFCLEELSRTERTHDLRAAALDVLLRLGEVAAVAENLPEPAPASGAPLPDLRTAVIERLYHMASPLAGPESRAQVEALERILREACESPNPLERFHAMAALERLGRPGMEEALIRFYEENREEETVAWSALNALAADQPHPYVHAACLDRIRRPGTSVGFPTAVRLLARWWPEEIDPLVLDWIRRREVIDPYLVLPGLLRRHRAAVVDWLKDELRSTDLERLVRVLLFIAGENVTEVGPALLERVRAVDPPRRPPFYGTLVALRTPGVEALLLAEVDASIATNLKNAAVTELLNLGGEEGVARVAALIEAGEGWALDALLRRARGMGERGVPEAAVPAVLAALRGMPGEDGRRAALFVLRFRARFDDTRSGLVEAYRHEPSRRFAEEIGRAIAELAHR